MNHSDAVVYRIDASDRIVAVNDAWTAFALANDGEHLLQPDIIGKNLWDMISDPTTRDLYETMVIRVRQGKGIFRFTFRCDSPEMRRLLQMEIAALKDHGVRFRVTPLSVQAREPVRLISTGLTRSNALMQICGWCKRLPAPDGTWIEIEEAAQTLNIFHGSPMPTLTHGICPVCHESINELLDDPMLGLSGLATEGE